MTARIIAFPKRPKLEPWTMRFTGKPGADGIHALKALLKLLQRRDFVCIDAREEHADAQPHLQTDRPGALPVEPISPR